MYTVEAQFENGVRAVLFMHLGRWEIRACERLARGAWITEWPEQLRRTFRSAYGALLAVGRHYGAPRYAFVRTIG
jgi:hypothetical protein